MLQALAVCYMTTEHGQRNIFCPQMISSLPRRCHAHAVQVELQAGSVVQRQILYTNPYTHTAQTVQCFKFTTNSPWLLSFQPGVLDLAPRDSKPLTLMIDARLLKAGVVVQALVFVQDELGRQEECLGLLVRCL
eukprot:GHUV01040944.1.p1 GENE.GHUV01040944.1~~GHUV01040944.1.p1  ORF type:complete len:134 (+),score=38.32 GHUV01040944.1:271-672(+)